MIQAHLWNVGLKASNLDAEVNFFKSLGAHDLVAERSGKNRAGAYTLLDFGGTRLFVTPEPIFENRLARPLVDGLTHIVFEVSHLSASEKLVTAAGGSTLIEPHRISAAFGTRDIAFFESPCGTVFELMTTITSMV